MNIKEFMGKTFQKVYRKDHDLDGDMIFFEVDEKEKYKMYHDQNCCESVVIKDIVGDLSDLVGTPIILAEERTEGGENEEYDSYTFTFYTIRTIKGTVDISWHGSSNGYYSEGVDLEKVNVRN